MAMHEGEEAAGMVGDLEKRFWGDSRQEREEGQREGETSTLGLFIVRRGEEKCHAQHDYSTRGRLIRTRSLRLVMRAQRFGLQQEGLLVLGGHSARVVPLLNVWQE